jgi:diacylglycerol kinase (ATP)
MGESGRREVLVVANEEAGSAERDAVAAAAAILGQTEPVELVYSRDRAQLGEILDQRDGRLLVVAGGDGSLHAVVATLYARSELGDCPLGLIPLGTGNDLARGLGIPLDPETAAGIIATGHSRRLDLLVDDTGGVVMNAVHLGVGASATRAAGAFKSRLGRFAYPIGALSAGVRAGGWRLVVRVDGEPIAESFDRVLMVAVSNGPSIGGGIAQVHPEAALDDGLAEVVVSGAVNPLARVGYAVDLARGKHLGRSDVQVHRGRHVAVTGDPFLTVADGEIDGPMTHRTWTLKPGAWQLAVPRPTGSPPLEHTSNAET